ncbi:extensin-like [Telopea speciosissima]|uniref:extensin-like n=1 Tax=Telopea speciosissima TaxID=54955 RepID=UPI001CC36B24|nr:extensin-like [Telopea speciosissima]
MHIATTVKDVAYASSLISTREREKQRLEDQLSWIQAPIQPPPSPRVYPDFPSPPAVECDASSTHHSFPIDLFKELQDLRQSQSRLGGRKSPKPPPSSSPIPLKPPTEEPLFYQPNPHRFTLPTFLPVHSRAPAFVPYVPPQRPPSTKPACSPLIPATNPNSLSNFLKQLYMESFSPPKPSPSPVSFVASDTTSWSSEPPLIFMAERDKQPAEEPTGATEVLSEEEEHTGENQQLVPPVPDFQQFSNQDPKQLFTFAGIPFHKWPNKILEFHAWLTAE